MTAEKQLTLPGTIVKKSNEIVRAKMRLGNVYAARVFTGVISCIKDSDEDFKEYTLPASAFIDVHDKGGSRFQRIKEALKTISGYVVEIALPIEDEQDELEPPYILMPLFAYAEYRKGKITAQIHPKLKPHFLALAGQFTSYNLLDYLKLSSTYSQRLFEILNSYAKTNTSVTIPLPDLHRMLDATESLKKDFAQFRRRALEVAYKEINEKTDLEYEWEPIKKGRSVGAIEFIFSKQAKEEAQKKQAEKERKTLNKHVQQALSCWKEKGGKEALVSGKCPTAKPKTKKCIACKKMGYFA